MNGFGSDGEQRWFFPTAIIVALFASLAALFVLGPVVAIKSGYVLFGLTAAALFYYSWDTADAFRNVTPMTPNRELVAAKLLAAIVLFSVAFVAAADTIYFIDAPTARTVVLLLSIPAGYLLLMFQLRGETSAGWLLPQVVALFAIGPITRFLATGFYFSRGDTPKHIYFTDLVASSGSLSSIPQDTLYFYFPGYHSFLGSTRLLFGLSSYDTYMMMGVLGHAAVICTAYLFARFAFHDGMYALFVALATSILAPIHLYSSYFFPQASATVLVLIFLYLAYRAHRSSWAGPTASVGHAVVMAPMMVALWFSHHLTVVLFAPILIALVAIPLVLNWLTKTERNHTRVLRPWVSPLVIWVLGSLGYWLSRDVFIEPLVRSIRTIQGQTIIASQSETTVALRAFGTSLPKASIETAAVSLLSPGGVYNIALVCVMALGFVTLLESPRRYYRAAALLVVGVGGSAVVLKTPIAGIGITRFEGPIALFVAVLVGIGLRRVILASNTNSKKIIPAVLFFLLLTASAPVNSADDLYALHSGPELWEIRPLPEPQKEFSEREMTSLERSASLIQEIDVTVATDWRSDIGLSRYGAESESLLPRDGHIEARQGLLLYRDRWPNYNIRVIPERLSLVTLLVTEDWMDRMVQSENKIYTTGEVGVLRDRPEGAYLRSG